MAASPTPEPGQRIRPRVPSSPPKVVEDDGRAAKDHIRQQVSEVRIRDPHLVQAFIRERQERDMDQYDEVWDGVYIVPALATNPHQSLVALLTAILHEVVNVPAKGQVFPGANVSDRRDGWERNCRVPDVVVVLNDSRAVDCTTHWWGGPDFLIEIQSPGDDTDAKIPFYARIQVRELLIIHRDTRELRLYRHNGQELALVKATSFKGGKWLRSEVLPLAFRRKLLRGTPCTQLRRTDRQPGAWTV